MDRGRRETIGVLAACLAAASTAGAQQPGRQRRVTSFEWNASPTKDMADIQRERYAIWAEHGLHQGRDVVETIVFAGNDPEQYERKAREVVAGRPDMILTNGASVTELFKGLTRDIPIVFRAVSDPVGHGIVDSLRRPGGNITGLGSEVIESMVKRLEILKEALPRARRVAWMTNADQDETNVMWTRIHSEMSLKASQVGLTLVPIYRGSRLDTDARIQALRTTKADGFIPYSVTGGLDEILTIQVKAAMPGFFQAVAAVRAGGFLSLGADFEDDWKQQIAIGARVLRGESPASMPVQQPTRTLLAVNLKTARALGIKVPLSILTRANEAID